MQRNGEWYDFCETPQSSHLWVLQADQLVDKAGNRRVEEGPEGVLLVMKISSTLAQTWLDEWWIACWLIESLWVLRLKILQHASMSLSQDGMTIFPQYYVWTCRQQKEFYLICCKTMSHIQWHQIFGLMGPINLKNWSFKVQFGGEKWLSKFYQFCLIYPDFCAIFAQLLKI